VYTLCKVARRACEFADPAVHSPGTHGLRVWNRVSACARLAAKRGGRCPRPIRLAYARRSPVHPLSSITHIHGGTWVVTTVGGHTGPERKNTKTIALHTCAKLRRTAPSTVGAARTGRRTANLVPWLAAKAGYRWIAPTVCEIWCLHVGNCRKSVAHDTAAYDWDPRNPIPLAAICALLQEGPFAVVTSVTCICDSAGVSAG
jgi:hypothetical protein